MREITGYERKNGKYGVRNHVLVMATVSCVNGVVNRISREVPEAVCVPHSYGCGRGSARETQILFRILASMVHHPNVGAVVLIGLGCERSNTKALLPFVEKAEKPVELFNVQDCGSLQTAKKGTEAARRMFAEISGQQRVPLPWDRLLVAMECGGSDAMSGVTANVALGAVSDWLVGKGSSVIFGENTEMIGTAHVLTRRARNEEVAKKIVAMIDQAEQRTEDIMGPLASWVISPGNMDGGMSTIAEKSMGCIHKGGTTTINQVVDYGEWPTEKGLILQDGPGYDDAGEGNQLPHTPELNPFHIAAQTGCAYGTGRQGQSTAFFALGAHDLLFLQKLLVRIIVERSVVHELPPLQNGKGASAARAAQIMSTPHSQIPIRNLPFPCSAFQL